MACSCLTPDQPQRQLVQKELRESDFIAEVEVVSTAKITDVGDEDGTPWTKERLQAEINVLRKWKGEDGITSVSSYGVHAGGCGLYFHSGQRLLLYAYVNKHTGHLVSDMCTRTTPIALADEDIALLNELARKSPAVRASISAPAKLFKQTDLTGVWSATTADGTPVTFQFLGNGVLNWYIDEVDIEHPDASPAISGRYSVRKAEEFWELDVRDIVGSELENIEFLAIFQPANSRRMKLEGSPSHMGERPTAFGNEAIEFLKVAP